MSVVWFRSGILIFRPSVKIRPRIFSFRYVSAMVPVKSVKEHDSQLDVAVLFSEVLERALSHHLVTQDQIDYCDPSVMIVIPRLSIVW